MILNQAQARELGEALLDAADATKKDQKSQAIVILDTTAVSVPFSEDLQDEYETPIVVHL
jgi:hypothetical protein